MRKENKRCELQIYTNKSIMDSLVCPKEMLAYASLLGLEAVAVTDKNSVESYPALYLEFLKYKKEKKANFQLIYGVEIASEIPVTLLAKNATGLQHIYKILTLMFTKYNGKRFPLQELALLREGLILGVSLEDYIEHKKELSFIAYVFLTEHFTMSQEKVLMYIKEVEEKGLLVVATGDVHYLEKEERHAYAALKGEEQKSFFHLKTTKEMEDAFSFLGSDCYKIVVENPKKIASFCEEITIFPKKLQLPKLENAEEIIEKKVFARAKSLYGEHLPKEVLFRLQLELYGENCENGGIIKQGFASIYLAYHHVTTFVKNKQTVVSSRGSIASSFVAYLLGITRINPLESHYLCSTCHKSIFLDKEGNPFYKMYACGLDLPKKACPICKKGMKRCGFSLVYETLAGIKNEEVPDIALNFSEDIEPCLLPVLQNLFPNETVTNAGTVGLVGMQSKQVQGYLEQEKEKKEEELFREASKISSVKRCKGRMPGKLYLLPKDVLITPIEHLDRKEKVFITHFNHYDLSPYLFSFQFLYHEKATWISYLAMVTGDDLEEKLETLKMSDALLTSFLSLEREYEKDFPNLASLTHPSTFQELFSLFGLIHGTGTWKEEIYNKNGSLKECISTRDTLYKTMLAFGIDKESAFSIMVLVGKGKRLRKEREWETYKKKMQKNHVPRFLLHSLEKIDYLFPLAHCVSYVVDTFLLAWYKDFFPLAFYTSYFLWKSAYFPIEIVRNKTVQKVWEELQEKENKTYEEKETYKVLQAILEAKKIGIHLQIEEKKQQDYPFWMSASENTIFVFSSMLK